MVYKYRKISKLLMSISLIREYLRILIKKYNLIKGIDSVNTKQLMIIPRKEQLINLETKCF